MDTEITDALLTTTRSVRKRLDVTRPVSLETIVECLALATQAPTGGNQQGWRFIVVTDPGTKRQLADIYRDCAEPALRRGRRISSGDDQQERVYDSALHLLEILAEVPAVVVPCHLGRPPADAAGAAGFYASILPAVWSFMLALRSRDLGSALTTSHLQKEYEAAEVLGIPYADVAQVALLPVASTVGCGFRPAARQPAEEVVFLDHWGGPIASKPK